MVFPDLAAWPRTQLSGKRIRVSSPRSELRTRKLSPFAVDIRPGQAHQRWTVFVPTHAIANYSFVFAVPPAQIIDADNYIGIWSDISGENAPLAVRQVIVQPLN